MADLFENIAPSWVTNHLYQLGDVVLYNKKLYQCTDKHTSSSDIDLDKFKPHTLADMVAGTTQLENFADMTVISDVVTNDDTYTYLEMPNNGVVSDKTKIATLNSNLVYEETIIISTTKQTIKTGFRPKKIFVIHASDSTGFLCGKDVEQSNLGWFVGYKDSYNQAQFSNNNYIINITDEGFDFVNATATSKYNGLTAKVIALK